jgi:hypothetical protein
MSNYGVFLGRYLPNKSLERTIYMRHGSCSELQLQLPRRIPLVAQFWRWAASEALYGE